MSDPAGALIEHAGKLLPLGNGVVAMGGGADSALAAHATAAAIRARGDRVVAVFVDHGLEHSSRLQHAAERAAAEVEVPFRVVEAAVRRGPGLEDRARRARRTTLEAVADGGWIVTGHTRDDQAETVLGNLLRGAGATGLAAMSAQEGRWIRPLLHLGRGAVRGLADELGLPYTDDPSNQDLGHRRNRMRHLLIPELEQTYNPRLREALARTADLLAEDDRALDAAAASVPLVAEGGAVLVPAPVLVSVPAAVAARAVRRALRMARPPYAGNSREVESILEVARGARTRAQLDRGWLVEREGPMVALFRQAPDEAVQAEPPVELTVPGLARFGRFLVRADRAEGTTPRGVLPLHPSAVGGTLWVRAAAAGERLDVGVGTRPVRDLMADAGIPRRMRSRWPVVVAHGKIAGLLGGRPAEWARARDPRGPVVRVSIERIGR